MDKLRLRFEKTERAIYISHLDLMHTLQRAFNRAELPLKYSEGFNPHPQISIALPLSVGASSVCEILDFKLKDEVPTTEITERLNPVLPEGIHVIETYIPERKVAELKWLKVDGILEYDDRSKPEMAEKLRKFYEQSEIVIEKRTKRGTADSDIRPAIREICFGVAEDCISAHAVISAQEPTLNPELLVDALRQLQPEIAPDFAKFRRIETFDAEMRIFR